MVNCSRVPVVIWGGGLASRLHVVSCLFKSTSCEGQLIDLLSVLEALLLHLCILCVCHHRETEYLHLLWWQTKINRPGDQNWNNEKSQKQAKVSSFHFVWIFTLFPFSLCRFSGQYRGRAWNSYVPLNDIKTDSVVMRLYLKLILDVEIWNISKTLSV